MLKQVFDGVFNGQDMAGGSVIAMLNHGRHCGGFTRTSRTCNQYQATFFHNELVQNRWQIQFLDVKNIEPYIANDNGNAAALAENIDPIISGIQNTIGKIHFHAGFKGRDLLRCHYFIGDALNRFAIKFLCVYWHNHAIDFDVDGCTSGEKKIRSLFVSS